MGSTFNPQILVEKLAKLNNSQQSIETLSHWCIFHMNKAKQVVETWDRQFHCSPREQRLAFLYLANDILQNSRRKGAEFVGEFWRVLPEALRVVIESGDEFGKNAALRLISIWDERKVFGSRGHILKNEFVGRQLDNSNREGKHSGYKLRHGAANTVDKIVSSYQAVYGGQLDEDSVLNKCMTSMNHIQKVEKEINVEMGSGRLNGADSLDELKGQHVLLRNCIVQLTTIESSRANLVNVLREALQEQEIKLEQIHNQLQAAQGLSEQAGNISGELLISDSTEQIPREQVRKENLVSQGLHDFTSESIEQVAPVIYARQVSVAEKSGQIVDNSKASAAAVAAKLTSSSSSAQMLTYVLSSLASEGVIGGALQESSSGFPPEKRPKVENDHTPYVPSENLQTHVQAFSHVGALQCSGIPGSLDMNSDEKPPPPSSPPPMPPLPPPMQPYPCPQYMMGAPTLPDGSYGYGAVQQLPVSLPGYPTVGSQANRVASFTALGNSYQSYPAEGGFYGQQSSSFPMAPISRE